MISNWKLTADKKKMRRAKNDFKKDVKEFRTEVVLSVK